MAGVAHPSEEVLASFVDRNGIVDDGGRPLKLVLARLRKTHKAEWYRRTNGQMEQFAIGHTAEVAANHYADIPALRALHEETVAAGLQDALDLALIPRVVLPEALMRTAPESAGLPVPPDEVIAFLDGSQDLWLASCSGFYASPFSDKGHPCPVPFWGCLDCGNAVITSRKLPSLIAFLSFMVAQRESLHATDWTAKFGRAHRRIAEQISSRVSTGCGCRRRQHCGQPGRLALPASGGWGGMTKARARITTAVTPPASRYVRDGDGVLDGPAIRPGVSKAALPLFGEDLWDVTSVVFRENARRCHCSVDFSQLGDPVQLLSAKEYLYGRLHEPEGGPRPRLAPASVRAVFNRLRRFMTFATARRGAFDLGALNQGDLDAWLAHLQTNGERASFQIAALVDVAIDLNEHADRLSHGGFRFTLWRGRAAFLIAGCPPLARENSTPRIPEPVIAAMLHWSLRYIDDFAPDILAARAELDRLSARAIEINVHKTRGAKTIRVAVEQRLKVYIRNLQKVGRGIPVWPADAHVCSRLDPVPVNYALIALHVGCRTAEISQIACNHAHVLEAVRNLGTEVGGMDPAMSSDGSTGQSWRPHRLDQQSLSDEEKWLQAACYVVCAYLTGMRDSEVQALRAGCHAVVRSADGLVERHRIHSTAYKLAALPAGPRTGSRLRPSAAPSPSWSS